MSIAATKQKSLMKRRKRAIILSAVLAVVLVIALVFVLDYANTRTYDDVDGNTYYIRKRGGTYAMYDDEKNKMAYDEEVKCYVTDAGTLIKVNADNGSYSVYAVVATEGQEVLGTNSRLLLFPRARKEDILSLEVTNANGSYTIIRYNERNEADPEGSFVIQSSPMTTLIPQRFTSLHVGAGYALSLEKLVDPIQDENGNYTEYGLAPEIRVKTTDENGDPLETPVEYAYEPAYYILTRVDGTRHKVIICDNLRMGAGCCAQHVGLKDGEEKKLPGVYVLDPATGECITAPIEKYVSPVLSFPMNTSDYYDVENFVISQRQDGIRPGADGFYDPTISFSFVDLALREGTVAETFPYEFHLDLDGFSPTASSIDSCLYSMYAPSFTDDPVRVLLPSDEDLMKYGLFTPLLDENGTHLKNEKGDYQYTPSAPYRISFDYDVKDDKNQYSFTVRQVILLSCPDDPVLNPNGNFFAYTAFQEFEKKSDGSIKELMRYSANMIVEVEKHCLSFLSWSKKDWVNDSYINENIIFVSKIELNSPEYNASFTLDNSASDSDSDSARSALLKVLASDSTGKDLTTFNYFQCIDVNGYGWIITPDRIAVYDAVTGEAKSMKDGIPYYDTNKLGDQVLCRNGFIDCKEYDVQVTKDHVRVYDNDHTTLLQEIIRYDTDLFREFYEMLLFSTIVDTYEPEDDAELEEIMKHQLLSITVTTKDKNGTNTNTYAFYQIPSSSRKAYITVNGNGGFYVYTNRVEKIIRDAQRFFAYENIDPTGKN